MLKVLMVAAALHGVGAATPATPPTAHHWTVAQGRHEIAGYEHDGRWIRGTRISDCRKIHRLAVRCTVTTPPIRIFSAPGLPETPQVWRWFDTARPNPGTWPRWFNVVSSDPVTL